jgi:hypothetical protein
MTTLTSVSQFRSEFDAFLYASIDDGGNSTLLSVLSVLARLDVDPWQEAANLDHMPRSNATLRLTGLIASLPGGPPAHLNCSAIADRLIALLPRQTSITTAPEMRLPGVATTTNFRAVMYLIIMNMIFMALAFGSQYFTVRHQPSAQAGPAHTQKAAEARLTVLPPGHGK